MIIKNQNIHLSCMSLSHTQESKQIPHEVYLFDGYIIVEVKRKNYVCFKITPSGESTVLDTEQSQLHLHGCISEERYLDYLTSDQLRKVDLLTLEPNYNEILGKIQFLILKVESPLYQPNEFDMQMAYNIEDIKDGFKQYYEISQEDEFLGYVNASETFFNEYFYENKNDLNEDQKQTIKTTLSKYGQILSSLKSN